MSGRAYRLGRKVNHDPRSRNFAFRAEGLKIQSVVHPRHIPILDQGDVGSCTANAGIGNLGTTPIFESLRDRSTYSLDEAGVLKLYSDEEDRDGDGPYPPQDNGSSGLTCAQVLKAAGIIGAYHHCFDAQSALLALSVTPFMFGTVWYDEMFNPLPDGQVRRVGQIAGGHEILCREYDAEGRRLWFDNSWGPDWGVNGRFYLTLEDFEALLNQDGDVTILLPVTFPVVKRLRRRYHHHHHKP